MDEIWKNLPTDILNLIFEYNITIRCRNGKYMNQIPNLEKTYSFILDRERVYIQSCKSTEVVMIDIPNSGKMLCVKGFSTGKTLCINGLPTGKMIDIYYPEKMTGIGYNIKHLYDNTE